MRKKILLALKDESLAKLAGQVCAALGVAVEVAQDGESVSVAMGSPLAPMVALVDELFLDREWDFLAGRVLVAQPASLLLVAVSDPENLPPFVEQADDIIVKPFAFNVLRARLKLAIKLFESRKMLLSVLGEYSNIDSKVEEEVAARLKSETKAQCMEAMGVLAVGVAHEINNPTTIVSGNLQSLERFWPFLRRWVVEGIKNNGEDVVQLKFILEEFPKILYELREGVLRVSSVAWSLNTFDDAWKSLNVRPSANEIGRVVEDALGLSGARQKMDVRVDIPEDFPRILCDARQLARAFANIFANAVEAMEKGRRGTLEISAVESAGNVELTIEDDGMGFEKDSIEKIWLAFYTTKSLAENVGLGLTVTNNIIDAHKGFIEAYEPVGGGAGFKVTLPKSASEG